MELKNFKSLIDMTMLAKKKTVAVACAHDVHSLEAVLKASDDNLLNYVLVGRADEIIEKAKSIDGEVSREDIIDCQTDEEAAAIAVKLVREQQVDFIQKGIMQTATLLKAVVNKQTGIGLGRTMSHVALFDVPKYHKLLSATDCGMVTYPDLNKKKDIIDNAVHLYRQLGYEEPKVAALCAVETVNPKFPETLEAAELKAMNQRGEIKNCIVEGPIAMDLAVNKEAARIKKFKSEVAGDADILLVPNFYTGNILAKALLEFSGMTMAGCVVGAKCPIALVSRSSGMREKYYSLLLCSLVADKNLTIDNN